MTYFTYPFLLTLFYAPFFINPFLRIYRMLYLSVTLTDDVSYALSIYEPISVANAISSLCSI